MNANAEEHGNVNQPVAADTSLDTDIHAGHVTGPDIDVTRPDTAQNSSSPMRLRRSARSNHAH